MELRNPRPNPYVGPRAFESGEQLHGREREARDLFLFLISQRIVLLHSPSGAGKTSLIQAGLIPRLREEGFNVLPVARVNLEPPENLKNSLTTGNEQPTPNDKLPAETLPGYQTDQPGKGFNRYIYSVLLSLGEGVPADRQVPLEQLAGMSLAEYLDIRYRPEFVQWALRIAFTIDPKLLSFDQLCAYLTYAGMGVGIMEWRPQKNGTHGTFRLATPEESSLAEGGKFRALLDGLEAADNANPAGSYPMGDALSLI